jgi:hypothetical protein
MLPSRAQDVVKKAEKTIADLASPEFHGRGYVNDGLKKAEAYIAARFSAGGAEPRFQAFTHTVNTFPDSVRVSLNGKKLRTGVDFMVHPNSGTSQRVFESIVINRNNFTDIDLLRNIYQNDLSRTHVVVLDPKGITSPDSLMEFRAMALAFANNLPVVILSSDKFTWSVLPDAYRRAVIEMRDTLFTEGMSIGMNIHNELKRDFKSRNVIAVVPGTHRKKKKKFLMVTAHYDHLGRMGSEAYIPGANDNASGVAMMLALFDHYVQQPAEYTLVFVAFAGEEAGLVGSKFYTENALYPLEKVRFLLNLDLQGTGDEGLTVVNATLFPDELKMLTAINDREDLVAKIKVRGEAGNSDHYWFTKAGVRCFFTYTLGGTKAYHDVNDRADQLPLSEFNDLYRLYVAFLDGL